MKYLKMYESFDSFNESDIHDICKKYKITNYTINDDLSIDVNNPVNLSYKELSKLPLRFRNVSGDFYCSENNLTSLDGCPIRVDGHFVCSNNSLLSLDGSPEIVGGNFYCDNNKLKTLKGSPEIVGGNFYCDNNKLKTLKGSPKNMSGMLLCNHNKDLISLNGLKNIRMLLCGGTLISNIYKLFKDPSKIELFNDYDCIRMENGKPVVIIDRLNDFLEEIGKPPVENIEGYINL
jgi:hypothetical protein